MQLSLVARRLAAVLLCLAAGSVARTAAATPALTVDLATGDVLYAQDATERWYPASTTKLMTVYVALTAVRNHQIAMDTPLVISARAHAMPPSKMGFPVGTQVTLDNALKMLLVRSANDIAITIAEGVSGSVEAFADDMNQAAAQLGLHESHFVNPNGLPNPDHYSSARDMAIIAHALYTQFPEDAQLFDIGALALGSEIIGNHNNLLGRYPGVDGMKTGFTCAAGFNVVASAFRNGRRLVVIVFGAPSVAERTAKVAALFDRGFAGIDKPSNSILTLASEPGNPPDMHNQVCRNRKPLIAKFQNEVTALDAPLTSPAPSVGSVFTPARSFLLNTQNVVPQEPTALYINSLPEPVFNPLPVHIGAEVGYNGVVAQARAPHTPVGSEPQPVAAIAYAAAPPAQPTEKIGGTPLSVDANALPLRGRKARLAAKRHGHGRVAMKAAAEAPKTKVMAGAEGDDGAGQAAHHAKPEKAAAKRKPAAKAASAKSKPASPVARRAAKPSAKTSAKVKPAAKKKLAAQAH